MNGLINVAGAAFLRFDGCGIPQAKKFAGAAFLLLNDVFTKLETVAARF
ncbi:MAG: hypothetical protein M3T96_00945 [Acidobacteriota bacterium]|nr:hypothetical protein [Acidobacteriota bacterium]